MTVTAAAVKHIDRSRASGKHYSAGQEQWSARVIGGDGVGTLEDGTRVFAVGASGMVAERAVVYKVMMVPVPAEVDDACAAALPNAVIGAAIALRCRAGLRPGETVLINGATGFTGKMAVQLARHYGAGKIIVTGRNEAALRSLKALGADETVSLQQDDDAVLNMLRAIHAATPVDVIIDYLWGHSAELLLTALKGRGRYTHKTRFVSVGAVTGDLIQLSAEVLRSVDLQLSGSGLGSWTEADVQVLFADILPEAFRLAANGQLQVDTLQVDLADIDKLWDIVVPAGKRLVVMI